MGITVAEKELSTKVKLAAPAKDSDTIKTEARLLVTWPQPSLAIFTPDMLELEIAKVTNGIQSHLMMIMKVLSLSREDALEHIAQMARDAADVKKAYPDMDKVTGLPEPPPQDEGPEGEEGDTDPTEKESDSEVSP